MRENGKFVRCEFCGAEHPATYSHEGRFGEGAVYEVVCTGGAEWLSDFYTEESTYTKESE